MRTIRHAAFAAIGIFLFCATASASEEKQAAAVEAARGWLAQVDAGDYGDSWQAASGYFRQAIARGQWRKSLDAVRRPLGKVLSRNLRNKTYATELPGAPDGEYVVIQFTTSFENKRSGVETVTPMLEADGVWRVTGYFIK